MRSRILALLALHLCWQMREATSAMLKTWIPRALVGLIPQIFSIRLNR